jgi:hypothetical protein
MTAESAPSPDVDEGGDAPCFADEVCEDCGVVAGEVHRAGCTRADPGNPSEST